MSGADDERRPWVLSASGIYLPAPALLAARGPGPAPTARRPAFEHLEPFLCASELLGSPAPKAAIIRHLRGFGRVPTFWSLAVVGATIANRGPKSRQARALTTDPLMALRASVDPLAQRIGDFVAEYRNRVIAHERVIYWAQCLALVACDDGEKAPSWADVAWLLLRANDHIGGAPSPSDGRAAYLEHALASFAVNSRFNIGGDALAATVRAYELTDTRPQDGPLSSAGAWEDLHRAAFFGMSFHEYFVEILSPLTAVSHGWGLRLRPEWRIETPVIHPERWYAETRSKPEAASEVFTRLSVSVEDARRELLDRLDGEGVPIAPTTFAHRPFLRLDDGALIAASPWLLREQLRLGLWDRCRRASHDLHGNAVWNPAFGQSFEIWAREAALRAARTGRLQGRLVLSPRIGDQDELEDVVIADEQAVMLGSAKSRLMPGDLLDSARDPKSIVDWYESVLFASATSEHRAGALHLLDRRVQRIRDGRAEGVASDARIYPVLITYERLGDTPVLHTWVHERCRALGVLQQPNVAPVTFVSAAEYEWLMAAAARAVPVFQILERRATTDHGLVTFESALRAVVGDHRPLRLPGVEDTYAELANETNIRLFGRPSSAFRDDGSAEAEDEGADEDDR